MMKNKQQISVKEKDEIVEIVPGETLPRWEDGGIGQLIAQYSRAAAGVAAIIGFGRLAIHYHEETGLPLTRIIESCAINYKTAMRYVAAARAAEALLSRGLEELPNSASAILSAAKLSDADRAEDLRAEIDKDPENPALQQVWRNVLAGEIPVGRWKPAYAGLSKTLGAPRKNTNYINLADRALATLRTCFENWEYLPGADKGKLAQDIAQTLFGDPERKWPVAPAAVLEEVEDLGDRHAAELIPSPSKMKNGGRR